MIPRRLTLRNFLSYREATVDFAAIHTAVLSGRNGDGKSALLDAMTWALWGRCRGRVEDDRIFVSATDMRVEFEFEADGDCFIVVRRRSRGRASGSLDLYLVIEGGRTTLTGGTVKETQDAINGRLHMDYDTFLNSAFIAQGRANEFTRKSATDRKEVFRKILGLERYENLSDAAGARRKEADLRVRELERQSAAARAEIARLPDVEAAIESAQRDLSDAETSLEPVDRELADVRVAQREYEGLGDALAREEARRSQLWLQRDSLEQRLTRVRQEHLDVSHRLGARQRIEQEHARLVALREQEHDLERRRTEAELVTRSLSDARQRIERKRAAMEAQATEVAIQLQQAVALAEAAEGDDPGDIDRLRAAIEAFDAERMLLTARERDLAAEESAANRDVEAVTARAHEVKARKTQLESAGAKCPTCAQPLSPAEARRAIDDCSAEQRHLRQLRDEARERAAAAHEAGALATTSLERLVQERRRAEAELQRRERDHASALATISRARAVIPDLEARASTLLEALTTGAIDHEAERTIEEATTALAALGYDSAAHLAMRDQLRTLASVETEFRDLAIAASRAASLATAIEQDTVALDVLVSDCDRADEAVRRARGAIDGATDLAPRLAYLEAMAVEHRNALTHLARRMGQLENERESLLRLKVQAAAAVDELRALNEERDLYDELHKAFGKDGVQAMLIDQSLPRVERIANEMLDRMTGGRISVALRTQRATKTGARETLDIDICDELGTRDYEMYSGGEAFRVDFALRIALARLLAERSGAQMTTLIIDEGFGTQDAEGIDRLTEALFAVQDDFRMVLVVTHIEEMKERFPARIEVTKDPSRGSMARVTFA